MRPDPNDLLVGETKMVSVRVPKVLRGMALHCGEKIYGKKNSMSAALNYFAAMGLLAWMEEECRAGRFAPDVDPAEAVEAMLRNLGGGVTASKSKTQGKKEKPREV